MGSTAQVPPGGRTPPIPLPTRVLEADGAQLTPVPRPPFPTDSHLAQGRAPLCVCVGGGSPDPMAVGIEGMVAQPPFLKGGQL